MITTSRYSASLRDVPGPSALRRGLASARAAWWVAAALRSLVTSVPFGAAVPIVYWLSQWRSGRSGGLVDALGGEVAAATSVVFGMAFVGALLVAWSTAPTATELARRADATFGEEERISTALEVLTRGATGSAVARALVAGVEGDAVTWPWRRTARVGLGVRAWGVVLLSSVLAVAVLRVPVPAASLAGGSGAASPGLGLSVPAPFDGEAVGRFAEVLGALAEVEPDPYFRAVAASFADLADRVAESAIDDAEARRLLDELLGHLGVAAEAVSPEFAAAVRDVATPEGRALAARRDGAAEPGRASELPPPDVASPSREFDGPVADASAVDADASLFMALQDLAGEVTRDPGSLGLRTPRASRLDASAEEAFYGGVLRAERDADAAPAEAAGLRADAAGAGDAVGGAERSTDEAGDAAGAGGAGIDGAADFAFAEAAADATAVAPLPQVPASEGRFVEIELVPDAVVGQARRVAREPGATAFDRGDEAAATVQHVNEAYRDVVGRYFMPGTAVEGDRP